MYFKGKMMCTIEFETINGFYIAPDNTKTNCEGLLNIS